MSSLSVLSVVNRLRDAASSPEVFGPSPQAVPESLLALIPQGANIADTLARLCVRESVPRVSRVTPRPVGFLVNVPARRPEFLSDRASKLLAKLVRHATKGEHAYALETISNANPDVTAELDAILTWAAKGDDESIRQFLPIGEVRERAPKSANAERERNARRRFRRRHTGFASRRGVSTINALASYCGASGESEQGTHEDSPVPAFAERGAAHRKAIAESLCGLFSRAWNARRYARGERKAATAGMLPIPEPTYTGGMLACEDHETVYDRTTDSILRNPLAVLRVLRRCRSWHRAKGRNVGMLFAMRRLIRKTAERVADEHYRRADKLALGGEGKAYAGR